MGPQLEILPRYRKSEALFTRKRASFHFRIVEPEVLDVRR